MVLRVFTMVLCIGFHCISWSCQGRQLSEEDLRPFVLLPGTDGRPSKTEEDLRAYSRQEKIVKSTTPVSNLLKSIENNNENPLKVNGNQ